MRCRKCNKHGGGAGGGAELRGGAETLRLPAPEDLHRAVSAPRAAVLWGGWGTRGVLEHWCLFLLSQDLPPGRVLLLPGVPHLPPGAAALLPEQGLPLPRAQEVSALGAARVLQTGIFLGGRLHSPHLTPSHPVSPRSLPAGDRHPQHRTRTRR